MKTENNNTIQIACMRYTTMYAKGSCRPTIETNKINRQYLKVGINMASTF